MNFVFLPEAEQDIDRLFNFLMSRNPSAAQKAMLAIDEGIQRLLETPEMGVQMEDRREYRQLFVPFGRTAYVLRYRLTEDKSTLVVVRVWHGREDRD